MLATTTLMLLALTAPQAETATLEFELKLQHRGRVLWWRTGVDQWARGELGLSSRIEEGKRRYSLTAARESPWVLRWYPGPDELKLGAVETVDAVPESDAYASLAPAWSAKAQALAASWWRDDPAPSDGALPPWIDRTRSFWSSCREREAPELADAPVYPFHVLGPSEARLRFDVDEGGSLDVPSIEQTMSEPWLPDGWRRAQRGERPVGYGFWEARRPSWEPALYQAIAAALELLDWPLPAEGGAVASGDVLAQAAAVATTLNPRARRHRLDWSGQVQGRAVRDGDGRVRFSGVPTPLGEAGSWRLWRSARYTAGHGSPVADELHLLVEDGCELRLWLRIGYRELQRSAIPSSSSR